MDAINLVRSEEAVTGEGIVIMRPEAVNMKITRRHRPDERFVGANVVYLHLHKFSCAVLELLVLGYHMKPLIQELPGFVLG